MPLSQTAFFSSLLVRFRHGCWGLHRGNTL